MDLGKYDLSFDVVNREIKNENRLHTLARNASTGVVCEVPDCNHTPAEPGELLCDEHLKEVEQAALKYEQQKWSDNA